MGYYSGQQGRMYFNTDGTKETTADLPPGDESVAVSNWSFSQTQNVLDTTVMDQWDRTLIAGTRQASGSARLLFYQGATGESNIKSMLDELQANPVGDNNTSQRVRFDLGAQTLKSTTQRLRFSAYITSIALSMAVGEVMAADVSFEIDGKVVSTL